MKFHESMETSPFNMPLILPMMKSRDFLIRLGFWKLMTFRKSTHKEQSHSKMCSKWQLRILTFIIQKLYYPNFQKSVFKGAGPGHQLPHFQINTVFNVAISQPVVKVTMNKPLGSITACGTRESSKQLVLPKPSHTDHN